MEKKILHHKCKAKKQGGPKMSSNAFVPGVHTSNKNPVSSSYLPFGTKKTNSCGRYRAKQKMLRCKEVRLTSRIEKRASARLYPETYQKPKDPLRCILSCPTYAPDPAKRPTVRWLSPSSSTTWNLPLRLPAYQISHTTGYLKILKRRFFPRINSPNQ